MRIFVSAAEVSSDLQAEKVLRALIDSCPGKKVEIYGLGGPAVRSLPGFRVIERAESMRAMGFVEVLSKLLHLRGVRARLIRELDENPPDVILTFDYPDFHFSLMRKISNRSWFKGALRICGIPPKVWVWRAGRVQKIREYYSGVWVIFPFEKSYYEDRGVPVIYEGNPLIADLFSRAVPKEPAVSSDEIRVAVLPGSREGELRVHLPLVGPTLTELSHMLGRPVHAEVPIPNGLLESDFSRELVSTDRVHYRLIPGGSAEVLSRNQLGLVKSGTSTLEAAVLGCVPVIFYRMNPISEWIFKRWVRYSGPVGLPNLLLGVKSRARAVFPEILGAEAKPDILATALFRLLDEPASLTELARKGEELRHALMPVAEVSKAIAERISSWIESPPVSGLQRRKSVFTGLVSFLWSSVNRGRRVLQGLLGAPAPMLPVRSILVGNLQAGGSGKTPMVIAIAKEALDRGYRVGVISRGYRARRARGVREVRLDDVAIDVGDEPLEIKTAVPEARVVLSADRLRASHELLREGVDLIIADDGFQNLKFRTEVTLLMVTDAERDQIPYRDFDSEAVKADFVIQTKGGRVSRFPEARLLEWSPDALPGDSLWLWTAIGDPEELQSFYGKHGVHFKRVFIKKDHAFPQRSEMERLIQEAERDGARLSITPKDSVKIDPDLRAKCVILRRNLNAEVFLRDLFEGLQ